MSLISLRTAPGRGRLNVDKANGRISGVSVMKAGPAMGHGFMIDDKMLNQIADQINAAGGVPIRYKHPQQPTIGGQVVPTDSLGTHVGRLSNARVEGDTVRGDIQFGPHSKNLPGLGDVQSYLMDLADTDPESFGLSAVFDPDEYARDNMGNPVGRSKGTVACDFTGEPAANPSGLLSMPQPRGRSKLTRRQAIDAGAKLLAKATGRDPAAVRAEVMALAKKPAPPLQERMVALSYMVGGATIGARMLGYKVTDGAVCRGDDERLSFIAMECPKGTPIEDLFVIAGTAVAAASSLSDSRLGNGDVLCINPDNAGAIPLIQSLAELSQMRGLNFRELMGAGITRGHAIVQQNRQQIHEVAQQAIAG